ncbi:phage repressor protein, partial [[Clostridium] innocuum]|nr:phage repressor protein [[Clostridium] innocuum]
LEGFQVFRMLDKEHQKEAMAKLNCNLRNPVRVDFIKANTIANKAVSNKHGYSKMLKKGTMSPQMLVDREPILEDTVELISVNEKFGLGISVSKAVYQKYSS